jgi:hypothetical protein
MTSVVNILASAAIIGVAWVLVQPPAEALVRAQIIAIG